MSIVSRSFKIIWRIIKLAFTLLVAFVCIFLLWRVFSRGTPKDLELITPNDKIYEAYTRAEDGELEYFTQDRLTLTTDGKFGIPNCIFIPEANQIQLVLRYNNSTIRALAEDYSLDAVPARTDELFDVTLLLQTDLTPDDQDDNAGNVEGAVEYTRCHGKVVMEDTKNLYNFRRIVFDLDECGLDLEALMDEGLLLAIYADVYYIEDVDYDETPYGTLFLYDYKRENHDEEISRKEEKLIREYGKGEIN